MTQFDRLRRFKDSRAAIKGLPERSKLKYREITDRTGKPESHEWELPERIVERMEGDMWDNHLFADGDGKFQTKLNSWESAVIEAEQKNSGYVGWLRNRERANWALEIPYEHGGERSFYPDFIIVRKENGDVIFDIIEPHRPSEGDTYAKSKGLAQYARDHGDMFGRLIMCRIETKNGKEIVSSFDVNDPDIRERALKLNSNDEVLALYEE